MSWVTKNQLLNLPRLYELGDREPERGLIAEFIIARFCEWGEQEPEVMHCLLTFSGRVIFPTMRARAPASVGCAAKPVSLVA